LNLFQEVGHSLSSNKKAAYPEWLAQAIEKIRDPQNFVGGTLQFAALAARSAEHVARETKKHLGVTPTDLVNDARLDYAAMQLETSTKKIIEISTTCGFENLGHFYKLFQKKFGKSPRKYRLYHQKIITSKIFGGS